LNIRNSRTSATLKVEVQLGIIGLHPLHSPPFVKVCFTPKHILCLMGHCTSHLVVDPMLKLHQLMHYCRANVLVIVVVSMYLQTSSCVVVPYLNF
jgi:hypothetical protein